MSLNERKEGRHPEKQGVAGGHPPKTRGVGEKRPGKEGPPPRTGRQGHPPSPGEGRAPPGVSAGGASLPGVWREKAPLPCRRHHFACRRRKATRGGTLPRHGQRAPTPFPLGQPPSGSSRVPVIPPFSGSHPHCSYAPPITRKVSRLATRLEGKGYIGKQKRYLILPKPPQARSKGIRKWCTHESSGERQGASYGEDGRTSRTTGEATRRVADLLY